MPTRSASFCHARSLARRRSCDATVPSGEASLGCGESLRVGPKNWISDPTLDPIRPTLRSLNIAFESPRSVLRTADARSDVKTDPHNSYLYACETSCAEMKRRRAMLVLLVVGSLEARGRHVHTTCMQRALRSRWRAPRDSSRSSSESSQQSNRTIDSGPRWVRRSWRRSGPA